MVKTWTLCGFLGKNFCHWCQWSQIPLGSEWYWKDFSSEAALSRTEGKNHQNFSLALPLAYLGMQDGEF